MDETVDELVAKLARSDQTIAALKSALVMREKRINELELTIARLERGEQAKSDERNVRAAEPPSSGRANQPLHPLIAETVGVYPDLWADVEAMVRFVDEVAGHKLRLSFFVPSVPGEETKHLHITPNFAAPTTLALRRGDASSLEIAVPSKLALRPELRIRLDNAEPRTGDDRRRLGVKIGTISLVQMGDERETQ